MICSVCDQSDRHSDLDLIPAFNLRQATQCQLIGSPRTIAESVPLIVIDGLDQPTVIPIDAFIPSADEFAKAVKVEFSVFSLGGDSRIR